MSEKRPKPWNPINFTLPGYITRLERRHQSGKNFEYWIEIGGQEYYKNDKVPYTTIIEYVRYMIEIMKIRQCDLAWNVLTNPKYKVDLSDIVKIKFKVFKNAIESDKKTEEDCDFDLDIICDRRTCEELCYAVYITYSLTML